MINHKLHISCVKLMSELIYPLPDKNALCVEIMLPSRRMTCASSVKSLRQLSLSLHNQA